MARKAWVYIWGNFLTSLLLVVGSILTPINNMPETEVFLLLLLLAIIAQMVETTTINHHVYHPHLVFFFAGVIMLPYQFFLVLVIVPHVLELVYKRITGSPTLKDWYIQPFNISTHIITGGLASGLYQLLTQTPVLFNSSLRVIFVLLIGFAYVMVSDLLIAVALWLARGITLKQSEIFTYDNLVPEFILLNLGYVVAVLWNLDVLLLIPALSPIIILNEILKLPQLKLEAQTDSKTGLLNARYFDRMYNDEFERARRFNRPFSLIMADLDLLRNINNTYGHQAGDLVLAGIAEIMKTHCRRFDLIGRFGGEEFAIALPETGPHEAAELAERLRALIAEHSFKITGYTEPIHATMSLGYASFPLDAQTTEELMRAADVALYHAKHTGRNRIAWFREVPEQADGEESDPSNTPPHQDGKDGGKPAPVQESELKQALERKEFEIYYQPIVSTADNRIIGVEALTRWHHPRLGLLLPENYIPLAEKTGLIVQLDYWVLEEACHQLQKWNLARSIERQLKVSVNMSALQFQQAELAERIAFILKETNLAPGYLQIELTESLILEVDAQVARTFRELQQLGVVLAIDDFGTGYTRFAFFKSVPISTIKIPHNYVRKLYNDDTNRAIARSMVSLGKELGLEVVAEGVEDQAEMAALEDIGCSIVQGYYFYRPLSRESLENLLLPTNRLKTSGRESDTAKIGRLNISPKSHLFEKTA